MGFRSLQTRSNSSIWTRRPWNQRIAKKKKKLNPKLGEKEKPSESQKETIKKNWNAKIERNQRRRRRKKTEHDLAKKLVGKNFFFLDKWLIPWFHQKCIRKTKWKSSAIKRISICQVLKENKNTCLKQKVM